jgi:TPR repeat protein
MYANGEGVTRDYAEAVKWYRKAANQGYARAQSNLGTMYSNGHGVPQDYLLAYMWFNVAASKLSEADRANAIKGSAQAARKLTPVELLRAEQMARDWKPSTPGGE